MTAAKPSNQSDQPSYRELNAELEVILLQLQGTDIDIDEALQAYERGLQIVKELETYLKTAENRVTQLKAKFGASS